MASPQTVTEKTVEDHGPRARALRGRGPAEGQQYQRGYPHKHVVTLKGTVTGQAGRAQATKVAKGTEGVHSVVNRLTIGPKLKD